MKHSLKSIIILSAAVITIILGVYVFRQQHYTFISIIIAIKLNRKTAKKKDMGTGEDKRKWRGKKGNEILPWYILTTECKIIYFGKSTLQNKKADIE